MVDNRSIDHLAVQRYHTQTSRFGFFRRGNHFQRVIDLFARWGIDLMQEFNLSWVNQRFAVKAEVFGQIRFRQKPSSLLISDHTTS